MPRPRSFRARRLCTVAGLAMLLPPAAQAAAYLPGAPDPDPPTGDAASAAPRPEAAPAGDGIRWRLGPVRSEGSLTLDLRRLRLEDGRDSTQLLSYGDIDFSTYIWEPWFVRLRFGFGLLAGRDRTSAGGGAEADTHGSGGATGRFAVAVFPASRYPFELRADVGDSRTTGETFGNDYRSTRVSVSQAWRPETGNDSINLNLDHSRLTSAATGDDTLTAFNATALRQTDEHTFELGASGSRNQREDTGDRNVLGLLSARHSFHPRSRVQVDTLATWNDARLTTGGNELASGVRQVSTLASWRPAEGDPGHDPERPLNVAGSLRWVEAMSRGSTTGTDGLDAERKVTAINGSLGVNRDLSRSWRASAALAAGRFDGTDGSGGRTSTANAALAWAPPSSAVLGWRWSPGASGSLGVQRNSVDGQRTLAGLQLTHTASNDLLFGGGDALAFSVSQSGAVLAERPDGQTTKSVAHSASLFWQSRSDASSQSFAGLTVSDARNWADESGRFQLINVQWSQRLQFSRLSAGTANVTLQGSRNDSTQIDAFSGERRDQSSGWQRFYTATVQFEQMRLWGVPRLRFTLLASANSQQLERRAFGDVDAPREHVTASVESRLDWMVGRLEARLSARVARLDERNVAALIARLQRRF